MTGPTALERAPLTGKVGLVVLPIVHIGGLWGLLQNLVTARPFVLSERFTLPAWRAAVVEHRPVWSHCRRPPCGRFSTLTSPVMS